MVIITGINLEPSCPFNGSSDLISLESFLYATLYKYTSQYDENPLREYDSPCGGN